MAANLKLSIGVLPLREFYFKMKKFQKLLVLLLFYPIGLSAQLGLMIEDQTKSGFKLVIDGYLQNEQAINKLNLQKLSPGEHELIFILENDEKIYRKIDLEEERNHQYVLIENFKGDKKLRYRGAYPNLKQSAMVLDFSNKISFVDPRESIIPIDTLPRYVANSKGLEKPGKDKIQTISEPKNLALTDQIPKLEDKKAVVVNNQQSIKDKPVVDGNVLASIDSTNKSSNNDLSKGAPVAPVLQAEQAFSALKNSIQLNNFEFDKIRMIEEYLGAEKITEVQLIDLLASLKYDQSRLQVIETALKSQTTLSSAKEKILGSLDYELSRQKAESFFK